MNEIRPETPENGVPTTEITQGSAAQPEHEPGHEDEPRPRPRIYVADLAAYNNGKLHGVWLDAARDPEDIHADIERMLATSPENLPGESVAEEFAIHDFDEFASCQIHEFDSIELVSRIALGIREHGYAFAAWADAQDGNPELFDQFGDAFLGHYDSLRAYAESLMSELGYEQTLDEVLPDDLRRYVHIDYDGVAQDLYLSGNLTVCPADEGGVWLFGEVGG